MVWLGPVAFVVIPLALVALRLWCVATGRLITPEQYDAMVKAHETPAEVP